MKYTNEEREDIMKDIIGLRDDADSRMFRERLCSKCVAKLTRAAKAQGVKHISLVDKAYNLVCGECFREMTLIIEEILHREPMKEILHEEEDDEDEYVL